VRTNYQCIWLVDTLVEKLRKKMETNQSNFSKNNPDKPKMHNHLKMMFICCGLPIVALIAISAFGLSFKNMDNLLLFACPIGMGVMMYIMNKSNKAKSCCHQEEEIELLPEKRINELSTGANDV